MRDPVCGMEVEVEEATRHELFEEYQGKRCYFCAAVCRQVFLMDPERFASQLEEIEFRPKTAHLPHVSESVFQRLQKNELFPWLKEAVARKASDLFLSPDQPPKLNIFGAFKPLDEISLTQERITSVIDILLPEQKRELFREGNEVDFGFGIEKLSRFRVNVFRTSEGDTLAIRPIPWHIPKLEELGLPSVLRQLITLPRGLILVTGPAGSGKSTTLASFVDQINRQFERHIITIEDPIEYVIPSQRSIVHQREVETHTRSFANALRSTMRENPQVIMVGELRDFETISLAIRAAETGHLVLGTLHSGNAIQSISRMLDVFEAKLQDQIRIQLSQSLKAIVSQRLLKRLDGQGMVVATEVLVNTPAVANLIRLNNTPQIQSYLQTGIHEGMHTLEASVRNLADRGLVDASELHGIVR